jgi:hypothetical protein
MMLDEHRTPRRFWDEVVNIAYYVSNRIYLRVHKKKTCYELMHGCTPKVSHFHVFGCKCFILKKGKKLDKFEARSVDAIFFGYASHSRAYRVLNLETNQIVETCEVTFDKTQPRSQFVFECVGDDELGKETRILPGVGWIGNPLLGLVNFWDLLWCLGLPANSRVLLNPLPRQNTLPQLVVALSSFGSHTP